MQALRYKTPQTGREREREAGSYSSRGKVIPFLQKERWQNSRFRFFVLFFCFFGFCFCVYTHIHIYIHTYTSIYLYFLLYSSSPSLSSSSLSLIHRPANLPMPTRACCAPYAHIYTQSPPFPSLFSSPFCLVVPMTHSPLHCLPAICGWRAKK